MSQWLPIHPTITDPSTGEPLRALTVIGNMPVWPSRGGQEDGDGSTGESGESSQGEDGDGDPEGNEGEQNSDGDGEGNTDTISKEEYDRLKARMQAADRRASAAEAKVKQHEDAGKTELDRMTGERDDALKRAETAQQALNDERIANAFLTSNKVAWHDPADALAMLRSRYMDGVEIDESGRVTGMEKAIQQLAKEKKYLVNSGSSTSSTDDAMNGKRKGDGKDNKSKDDELAKRMPALARNRLMT